ncbi:MAG: hypothetical protein COV71_03005 [Candidatus Omnitrophica bacterium CG11_big_fil_rev_8_21_14_0_20_41_12]|nr:MAG: hypothetical protein COV71_03005 [Candidatus Omnitrophica bacterium CG11_big_fil_rev_8_21_14_0_20_41_12]
MHKHPKKIMNKKGIALIATYMTLTILLAYSGLLFNISTGQNKTTNTFKRQAQATDIAEAGLDRALNWLRAQPIPPGSSTNPWGGIQNLGNPVIGSYNVAITDLGSPGGSPSAKRYRITSTGTVGGITQVVTNYLQTDNYARYIWFTNREQFGPYNVWFWDQDRLNGPTHTNGHFNIKGTPIFDGEVRSVDDYIRYFNNGNNINSSNLSNPPYDLPDFQDTVTLGADSTNMPTQALNLRTASTDAGGLRLNGNTTIVLNADGTMNVTNSKKHWSNQNMALPANGALFVDKGSLTISGTLNGRLTAGASRDINIPNNIIYADDPRVNPASTDTLGLIAEQDVMIDHSAPSNLEVDASIMALNTSFMLESWWQGPAKGTLTVFGGIIQNQRGPVGTFSGTTKVSGYSKNYDYDQRLLSSPPPFVPTTGDYITLSWEN